MVRLVGKDVEPVTPWSFKKRYGNEDTEKRLATLRAQHKKGASAEDAEALKKLDHGVVQCQKQRDQIKQSMQAMEVMALPQRRRGREKTIAASLY